MTHRLRVIVHGSGTLRFKFMYYIRVRVYGACFRVWGKKVRVYDLGLVKG